MGKLSLNEFVQSAKSENFESIRDPQLILSIVEKMWSIPFAEMFHVKCRGMEPSPWDYIYEEFVDIRHLISVEKELFLTLPFGEIVLILDEQIRKYSEYLEREIEEDIQPMNILIVFGRLYMYFM